MSINFLKSEAERRALKALELPQYQNLNLNAIKTKLKEILEHIRDMGLFTEYTQHDISHIDGMLDIVEDIIPEQTKQTMTSVDWLMLVLCFYFHDYGMLVTREELNNKNNDSSYLLFKKNHKQNNSDTDENSFYQDYVRVNHGERIFEWINYLCSNEECPDKYKTAVGFLKDMIGKLGQKELKSLAALCQSHQQKMADVVRQFENQVKLQYSQQRESRVNLLYIASVLRTTDLLHICSERTPDIAYKIISPQNSYSRCEWNFQQSVSCIIPRDEKNRDGKVDKTLPRHCFEIQASFSDDKAYSRLNDYLDYAERELKETHEVCRKSQEENDNNYIFPWDSFDRTTIRTEGFLASPVKFELDKKSILHLLIGHTLYNNPNVVLRELAQNSIDACRLMNSYTKEGSSDYVPKVKISWNSKTRILKVQDNGTGMNENIILNYLVKVGVSRYQSEEFRKENTTFHSISRFGIGLLTCFMISDDIQITSLWYKDAKANRLCITDVSDQYILRTDVSTDDILEHKHGTTFILKVHDDVNFEDVLSNLCKWIVIPRCEVEFIENGISNKIGYKSEEDAMKSYLSRAGIKVDGKQYRIQNKTIDDKGEMYICCLQKKSSLYGDWNLYTPDSNILYDDAAPLGVCVEGIMVTRNTPGFNSRVNFTLLNCTGKESPSTNVARDQLEDSDKLNFMLGNVYKYYLSLIQDKIEELEQTNSLSWSFSFLDRYIDNFVDFEKREMEQFSNSKIFNEVLSNMKCFLVDEDNKYTKKSLAELGDEVWTIESYAFSSAIHLSQEISKCPSTAFGILKDLGADFNTDIRKVLSITDSSHYTYKLFLEKFEISNVLIDANNRKMEFKWELNADRNLKIFVDRLYISGSCSNCVIILRNVTAIDGIDNNIHFINSHFGLIILPSSPLNSFLCDLLAKNEEKSNMFVEFICKYITKIFAEYFQFSLESFRNCMEEEISSDYQDFCSIEEKNKIEELLAQENYQIVNFAKFYNQGSNGIYD